MRQPVPMQTHQDKPEMLQAITMSCPNCGALLNITSELETFACAYCGSAVKVTRQGGTVTLTRLEQTIGDIRSNTDRIAAELALVRLGRELGEVNTEIIMAENDLGIEQSGLRPVLFFDHGYPLRLSGERNWAAGQRHELTALIMWAAIAVVIGLMAGFVAFAVVLTVSWYGILASRNSRIREIKESNSRIMSTCASLQTHLDDLRNRETSLNQQIRTQRSIIGAA